MMGIIEYQLSTNEVTGVIERQTHEKHFLSRCVEYIFIFSESLTVCNKSHQ